MKHKNWNIFAWMAQVSVILSTFLLSVGLAIAQPAKPNAPESAATTTISIQERQELERLRQERRLQQQVQAEANRAFSQTTTLFNIMLATLALLLASAIIALFSVLCAISVFFLDRWLRKRYEVTDQTDGKVLKGHTRRGVFSIKAIRHLPLTFWYAPSNFLKHS